MRTKRLFITIHSILVCFSVFSQVNLTNGAAQVSIPLYSYIDPSNRIGTAISLDYVSGNGFKVNEIASSVGTGWALNIGGAIVRKQRGEADDQKNNNYFDDDPNLYSLTYKNYFPNGYLYSEFDPSIQVDNGGGYTKLTSSSSSEFMPRKKYLADREQDEFEFSFNGRSGRFVIGKDGSIRTIQDSKLKIRFDTTDMWSSGIRTKIYSFCIKDENGINYIFRDLELSELIKYNQKYKYAPTGVSPYTITYGKGIGQFVVSKWHLSEIINPFTNKKITFKYDSYDVDINANEIFQNSNTFSHLWLKIKGNLKRVKTIFCSEKEKVEFIYFDNYRADLPSDHALSSIIVKYDNIIKYSWNFSFGYFLNSDIVSSDINSEAYSPSNIRMNRLCLTSLQKRGFEISEPPYTFEYNHDHRIANMFSYYHDHWGYANNDVRWGIDGAWPESYDFQSQVSLQGKSGPLNNPNLFRGIADKYAANGVIKTVHYPLGGSLTFEYEQNSVLDISGTVKTVGGVRVKNTKVFDGINHDNDIFTEYKYVKSDGNTTSGWGGYESFIYGRDRRIRIYKTDQNKTFPGSAANAIASSLPKIVGGISQEANYQLFHYGTSIIEGYLVAAITQFGTAMIADYILNVSNDAIGSTYREYIISESYSEPVNGNNLLPVLYSRVILRPQNNGYTVYEFTDNIKYPVLKPEATAPYSEAPRLEPWKYGLPKTVSVFDKYNNPIKKVEYEYSDPIVPFKTGAFYSQKWAPNADPSMPDRYAYFDDDDRTNSDLGTERISHEFYYPAFGRIELLRTKEYTYKTASEAAIVTTDYSYSADNYQLNTITTTNSKNEQINTITYYPLDYTLPGVYKTMRDSNIVNIPIATQTLIKRNNINYAIEGSVNDFGFIANGDIRSIKNYVLQSTESVQENYVKFYKDNLIPNVVPGFQYYKEQQQLKYNSSGALEEIKANNKKVGKVFGYDGKLAIAEITNAGGSECFYDSFEETGTWEAIDYDNTKVHFGKLSGRIDNLNIGPKSVAMTRWMDITLAQATKYKVSAWVYSDHKNAMVWLDTQGASGTNTIQVGFSHAMNKWEYVEAEVTIPSDVTKVKLRVVNRGAFDGADYGGTIWFDDVRFHPSNSRMVTYTYDPLVGVTSQTDANNRSIFYEYDGLGRVIHVLDNDHNILKKYCYNFSGQPESCPLMTVGNDQITRTFRKNNCDASSGLYGTEVTYLVPAGKYFGVDKEHANLLANNEIDKEGQAYANLIGKCVQGSTNQQQTGTYTTQCVNGRAGTQITYIVSAGKYAAASPQEADQLALNDVQVNGQAYANTHGSCYFYSAAIDANYYSQICTSSQTPAAYHVIVPAGMFYSSYSQDAADVQARWYAQQQADQNGTCTNVSTQVYARLEVIYSSSGSTTGDYNEYYDGTEYTSTQLVSIHLRFYSDAACTQSYTLTSIYNYEIDTYGYFETNSGSENRPYTVAYQGTAPAGVSEVEIDLSASFDGFWGFFNSYGEWNYYEKWNDNYELMPNGSNVIIATPVYPSHIF